MQATETGSVCLEQKRAPSPELRRGSSEGKETRKEKQEGLVRKQPGQLRARGLSDHPQRWAIRTRKERPSSGKEGTPW